LYGIILIIIFACAGYRLWLFLNGKFFEVLE